MTLNMQMESIKTICVCNSPFNQKLNATRLLGRPQPQMYPPVTLNQYTWVNSTHKHFVYMLQGPMKILK